MRVPTKLVFALALLAACGRNGSDGTSCSVTRDEEAGTTTIACEDGTTAVIPDGTSGANGQDGASGADGANGTDGTDGANGQDGTDGQDGANGQDGADGQDGVDGMDGTSCTGTETPGGGFEITCDDGTTFEIPAPSDCPFFEFPDGGEGYGEWWAYSPSDLEPLRGCQVLIGTLHLMTYEDLSALSDVTAIVGDLDLWNDEYGWGEGESVDIGPSLTYVQGEISVYPWPLRGVNFPALRRTTDLERSEASGLESFSAPELVTVTDDIQFSWNNDLTSFSAPKLESVDVVHFEDNSDLTTLDLSSLKTAGAVELYYLPELTSTDGVFSQLESVINVSLNNLDSITRWDAPKLVTVESDLQFAENDLLAAASWNPNLEIDGTLRAYYNPSIAVCDLPVDHATYLDAYGNLSADGATCDNCPGVDNPDQLDLDRDGFGDECDDDADGDGVDASLDTDDRFKFQCSDSDADGCDDCRLSGSATPLNDGPDADADGQCDSTAPLPFPGEDCQVIAGTELLYCAYHLSVPDALFACQQHGGRLWAPRTASDLRLPVDHPEMHEMWIGVSDSDLEGTFTYTADGSALTVTPPWNPSEPNDSGGHEDCVQTTSYDAGTDTVGWNDLDCFDTRPFTCEAIPAPIALP